MDIVNLPEVTSNRLFTDSKFRIRDQQGLLSDVIFGSINAHSCLCGTKYSKVLHVDGFVCPKCNVKVGKQDIRYTTFGKVKLQYPILLSNTRKQFMQLFSGSNSNYKYIVDPKQFTVSSQNYKFIKYDNINDDISFVDSVIDLDTIPLAITGIYSLHLALQTIISLYGSKLAKSYIECFTTDYPVIPPSCRLSIVINERNKMQLLRSEIDNNYQMLIYLSQVGKYDPDNIHLELIKLSMSCQSLDPVISDEIIDGDRIAGRLQLKADEIYSLVLAKLSGKQGMIRKDFLGRMIDFSGRAIIIPNSNLKAFEIKLPLKIFSRLWILEYFKYIIRFKNEKIDQFKPIIQNSANIDLYDLHHMDDFVDYFFKSDDVKFKSKLVCLNRQPTLHRFSIASALVVGVSDSDCIELSTMVLEPYAGDFDGDSGIFNINVLVSSNNEYFVKNLNIKDIGSVCKLQLVESSDTVKNYVVVGDLKILAIDEETANVAFKKITHWSEHINLNLYKISKKKNKRNSLKYFDFETFWVSSDHSMICFDNEELRIKRVSPLEVIANKEKYCLVANKDSRMYSDNIRNIDIVELTRRQIGYFRSYVAADSIGYLVGQYCHAVIDTNYIRFYNKNPECFGRLFAILDFISSTNTTITGIDFPSNLKTLDISSNCKVGQFLLGFDKFANSMINFSDEFLFGFFAGLIDGGSYISRTIIKINTDVFYKAIKNVLINRFCINSTCGEKSFKIYLSDNSDFIQKVSSKIMNCKKSKKLLECKPTKTFKYYPILEFIPCIYLNIELDLDETTGYDLTVSDYKTFATQDGVFVYDTMAVYRVHDDDAQSELAGNMFIQNQITYDHNNNFLHQSRNEIHYCGKLLIDAVVDEDGGKVVVSDLSELQIDYNILRNIHFKVEVNNKVWSYGLCLINKFAGFTDVCFTKIENICNAIYLDSKNNEEYHDRIARVNRLLVWLLTSLEKDTLTLPFDESLDVLSKYSNDDILQHLPKNPYVGHHILSARTDRICDELDKDSNLYRLIRSKFKKEQFARSVIGIGYVADDRNIINSNPITSTLIGGLDEKLFFVSSQGSRKGIVDKSKLTPESGYLERTIVMALSQLEIVEEDCGSNYGFGITINSTKMAESLIGRYYFKNNQVSLLTSLDVDFVVGKTIHFRSPLTCQTKHNKLCRKCFGDYKIPSNYVGILAGQVISERITQLSMSSFHTSGSASLPIINWFYDMMKYRLSSIVNSGDSFSLVLKDEISDNEIELLSQMPGFNFVTKPNNIVFSEVHNVPNHDIGKLLQFVSDLLLTETGNIRTISETYDLFLNEILSLSQIRSIFVELVLTNLYVNENDVIIRYALADDNQPKSIHKKYNIKTVHNILPPILSLLYEPNLNNFKKCYNFIQHLNIDDCGIFEKIWLGKLSSVKTNI